MAMVYSWVLRKQQLVVVTLTPHGEQQAGKWQVQPLTYVPPVPVALFGGALGEAEAHWHSTYYLNWLNVAVSNLPDTYSAAATYIKRVCRRPISNMTQ